jgi:hypothetical protein
LCEEVVGVLLGLLLLADLFLEAIDLRTDLRRSIISCSLTVSRSCPNGWSSCPGRVSHTLSVFLKVGYDLIHDFDIGMSLALRLSNLFGITAPLGDEVVATPRC